MRDTVLGSLEAEEKERKKKEFRAFVTETEQPDEEQLIFMDNDLDENDDNCEEEIPDDLTGDEIEEIIENQHQKMEYLTIFNIKQIFFKEKSIM